MTHGSSELQAMLSAYLDGELDAAARAKVEAQMQLMPVARDAFEEMRRIDTSLRSAPVPDPGSAYWQGFADRVASRLGVASGQASVSVYERLSGWLFHGSHVAWLRAAGALAMLTLVALLAAHGFRARTPAPGAPLDGMARNGPAAAPTPTDKAAQAPTDKAAQAPTAADTAPPQVATFIAAALDQERDAALAAYAQLERDHPDAAELETMREWIEATSVSPAALEESAKRARGSQAGLQALSAGASPSLAALQALDALVWPRRDIDAAAVEGLAQQLEALAQTDVAATPLGRRYLEWLAAASPDSAAAGAWLARLRGLDG